MNRYLSIAAGIFATLMSVACSNQSAATSATAPQTDEHPGTAFCADSAYAYVARQVEHGPRVPGTDAHKACADMLGTQLRGFGADTVIVQRATVIAYNGDRLPIANILARYNPGAQRRVLVLSHWDSRPWADNADDSAVRRQPIDGANDGASGVGVILEIARQLGIKSPAIGVDLLLVDAEDYGRHADDPDNRSAGDMHDTSWALGTQYWAESQPYKGMTAPEYGILLDMVGGHNARFPQEYFSRQLAPAIVDKVWARANALGLGDRFPSAVGGAVTDDHIYVNRLGIPTIDIIECANPATGSFNPTWHTPDDNLSNISATTLGAVGTLVLDLIYR